jgi:transposase
VDRHRDRAAFRHLLFDFDGILITDRFSVYRAHERSKRQICWAHLLRNFRGLEEYRGEAKRLGVEGQKAVKEVFRWWYRYKAGEITRLGLRRGLAGLRARFRWLMGLHERNPVRQARAIARDLIDYEECLWTFARVEGIEPTNNLAERTLRKAVLWRKGSFGSASVEGGRFVERMLTVTESLRAQGRSILDFLVVSIRASLNEQAGPSLVPARAA